MDEERLEICPLGRSLQVMMPLTGLVGDMLDPGRNAVVCA
jgi:hypothetical protein